MASFVEASPAFLDFAALLVDQNLCAMAATSPLQFQSDILRDIHRADIAERLIRCAAFVEELV